jgi:hypothetical protein
MLLAPITLASLGLILTNVALTRAVALRIREKFRAASTSYENYDPTHSHGLGSAKTVQLLCAKY